MSRTNNTQGITEPFPSVEEDAATELAQHASTDEVVNRSAASSSLSSRLRRVSQSFEQSELPPGFLAATGGIASSLLSRQAVPRPGATPMGSSKGRVASLGSTGVRPTPVEPVAEDSVAETKPETVSAPQTTIDVSKGPPAAAPFANGYHFPPKHSSWESTKLAAISFWNYFLTPVGFAVIIYGLNVVAWGGMLFLLLCNASPAMCHPTCNDINSPRRKWVEWDSQILNALFCVTGFGLAPWRFRDLYFLLQYRLRSNPTALRRLAGIHRGWFRLPGSQDLPPSLGPGNIARDGSSSVAREAVPFPEDKIPNAPLTGVRARATRVWKLDLAIWLMVANTLLQCVLCGFMWGLNRYNRPSWATGLFVGLGCGAAGIGGFIMFLEGKAVKGIEGVPLSQRDYDRLERDREQGIFHFNNIDDKDIAKKEKKGTNGK